MMRVSFLLLSSLVLSAFALPVSGQLTVQQPVFQNFSAATTVSVPDRGNAFIGGVNRAASERNTFGPLRSGNSLGLSREASGMSVGVSIHDFAEMDRQILGRAPVRDPAAGLSGNAAHAWQSLAGRESRPAVRDLKVGENAPADRAAKFLTLGEKAEERGAVNVARMHYRLAAKYGSAEAAQRLHTLEVSEVVSRN